MVTVDELGAFLEQPRPRRIPPAIRRRALKRMGRAVMGFGLVFVLFGLPFLYVFFPWRLLDDLRLGRQRAVVAEGIVTGTFETSTTENGAAVYRHEFAFTAQDGVEYHGTCYSTGSRLSAEQEVRVQYLPDAPEVCRIEGCRLSPFGWGAGFVAVFPLIGSCMVFFPLRSRWRTLALLSSGAFSSGRIEGVEETNVQVNGQTHHRITLSFADAFGVEHRASYYAYGDDVALAETKQAKGDTIGVLYDARNPKRVFFVDTLLQ